jgi:hypothetical protein
MHLLSEQPNEQGQEGGVADDESDHFYGIHALEAICSSSYRRRDSVPADIDVERVPQPIGPLSRFKTHDRGLRSDDDFLLTVFVRDNESKCCDR